MTNSCQVKCFRSLWGMPNLVQHSIDAQITYLIRHGFDGVEASLRDLGYPDMNCLREWKIALDNENLAIIVGVYSNWIDYEGPYEYVDPESAARRLIDEIHIAKTLGPVRINAHVHGSHQDAIIHLTFVCRVVVTAGVMMNVIVTLALSQIHVQVARFPFHMRLIGVVFCTALGLPCVSCKSMNGCD